jgi:hypothetical protein
MVFKYLKGEPDFSMVDRKKQAAFHITGLGLRAYPYGQEKTGIIRIKFLCTLFLKTVLKNSGL